HDVLAFFQLHCIGSSEYVRVRARCPYAKLARARFIIAVVETAAEARAIHNVGQARKRRAGAVMEHRNQTLSGGKSAHVSSQMILEAVQGAFVDIREIK